MSDKSILSIVAEHVAAERKKQPEPVYWPGTTIVKSMNNAFTLHQSHTETAGSYIARLLTRNKNISNAISAKVAEKNGKALLMTPVSPYDKSTKEPKIRSRGKK